LAKEVDDAVVETVHPHTLWRKSVLTQRKTAILCA
jgi:hypothetical protein